MGGEWNTCRLDDLCEFINGFAFKSTDYVPPSEDTIEVFRMGYIERGGGFKEDSTPVFVPREYGKDLERFILKQGDITIAMTDMKDRVAILGNTAWISGDDRFVLNQRVGCLRVKRHDLLDARFLYYYSNWSIHVDYLRSRANSGVQVNLSTAVIKESEITFPTLPEQRAIAHILGTLDDKIELNRRRNQTLEAMARALFKDWFVDFGPVRAKMEGREPYLPADLWQLFPDRLDDEGKPEGWKDDCLGSFTNIKNGYAFKSKDWCEAGVPVVKIGSVKPSFVDISQVSFIDVTLAREKESFRLNVGDMLVGLTGYVGETGRIPPTDNRPMLNQRVGKFEPFDSLEPFVFACVRMPDFKVFAESKAHGSAQANVSTTELLKYPVVNPGRELLEAFCRMLEPLFLKSLANEGEQATLSRLRDTLLPKLISGELRIQDAEQFIEAAQ